MPQKETEECMSYVEGDGRAEFLLISLWESFDAIRKFAGPQIEKAVYYPKDKEFLLELEPHVVHYEVVVAPESREQERKRPVPSEYEHIRNKPSSRL